CELEARLPELQRVSPLSGDPPRAVEPHAVPERRERPGGRTVPRRLHAHLRAQSEHDDHGPGVWSPPLARPDARPAAARVLLHDPAEPDVERAPGLRGVLHAVARLA